MLRVPRWALTALLALIIAMLPFGASWADPGRGNGRDDAPAHGRDKEHEDQDETTDEDSYEASEEEQEPDEATAPSEDVERGRTPSGRPSPSSSPQDASDPFPGTSSEVIDVSFSASPVSIAPGETSTIQIVVSNPTSTPVGDAEVLVALPAHLDLVSSQPQAAPDARALRLSLGGVAAGEAASASVIVVGLDAAGAQEAIRFAVTADGDTFHHELFVGVENGDPAGLALAQSSPLLIQVGDSGPFSATVSNNGPTALEDVIVVTEIAPELDVVGVTPTEAADAIQVGASPAGEDIVWVFDALDPGEQVSLDWTARAVVPGDLQAGNVIEATLQGQPAATSTQQTYLGFVRGVRTESPDAPASVVRERVVTKLVPVSTEVSAAVGGGILPVTGWSPGLFGFGGAALIAFGLILVWGARGPRSRRLALVLAGALLLTGTACVSDTVSSDPEPDAGAVASPSPTESEADDEEEPEDEVLGVRIERPDRRSSDDAAASPPSAATAPAETEVVEPVTEVVYEEVSEVISVVVPTAELPVESLGPRAGDNTFSLSWNPVTGDLQGTSGRMITRDATEELLVGVSSEGDRLAATVTVANLADGRRLHVQGRLALEIVASDGRTSTLVSGPIDVILEPGANTTADLAFSLPSGSYSARGAFLAD